MNRQVPIDKNESNPMLLGLVELVKEDSQALQKQQQELNQAMNADPGLCELMEQQKKERLEMQLVHQKKMNEMMKENSEISQLMEQHKKELAELQLRQRQTIEKAMSGDEAIMEMLNQQREEANSLRVQHQKTMNERVNTTPTVSKFAENVKAASQALQERQLMLDREMFKATYLTPVMITPEPRVDEEGNVKLAEGSKVTVQVLPLKDNKAWIMAFTDRKEFKKWAQADGFHTMSMTMKEFFGAVIKDHNLAGVAINPFSANLVMPRERIEAMVNAAASHHATTVKSKNVEVVEGNIHE